MEIKETKSAEELKELTKEIIDQLRTQTEEEKKIVKLIYGFAKAGLREETAGRC